MNTKVDETKRYNILIDSKTNLVVWMTEGTNKRIPQISYELFNEVAFVQDLSILQHYKTYRLYFNNNITGLFVKEPNNGIIQNIDTIRMLRAKLNVISAAIRQSEYAYLRNDNIQIDFFKKLNVDDVRAVSFIQQEYNLSKENAIKFIQFKKEEYRDLEFENESNLHRFINRIKNASTLEEVVDIYKERMTNVWDASKPGIDNIVSPFTL